MNCRCAIAARSKPRSSFVNIIVHNYDSAKRRNTIVTNVTSAVWSKDGVTIETKREDLMDYTSAAVIIAPHRVQAFAVPLMRQLLLRKHDARPGAHHGAVSVRASGRSRRRLSVTLREVCADVPPFDGDARRLRPFPERYLFASPPIRSRSRRFFSGFTRFSRLSTVSRRVRPRRHHAAHDGWRVQERSRTRSGGLSSLTSR